MSDTERTASARAIHELTSGGRSHLKSPTPPRPAHSSDNTSSTFDPARMEDDALMSTRHNISDDSRFLPKNQQELRATAQKYAYYNPPEPQPHVPTSAVNRAFQDFDHGDTFNGGHFDDSESVEMGRGLGHTPSRANRSDAHLNSDILFDMNSSFNNMADTPPTRPRPTPKSSLRRDAALRRASGKRPSVNNDYANAPSQRPEGPTTNARASRFGRQVSGSESESMAPQHSFGTPRSAANGTAQSFMLPDLPNLTELVSGAYKDGTPIFPRSGKKRSLHSSAPYARPSQPNFIPLSGIPVPDDEKAILASLQLLKDKVTQLEQEKSEADRKTEEFENEVVELRAQLESQRNFRRSDSALGSTDGEADANGNTKWQVEKTQLETSIQSLQKRLERADRKTSVAEIATKRITGERDSLVTQLGVAFYNAEELKAEIEALRNDNRLLQDQVTDLQAEKQELVVENEALRDHVDQSHDRHEGETQQWARKEVVLERKATTTDRAIFQENQTLREELVQMRQHQEELARKAARQELKARREAEKESQAEHAKLADENEILRQELEHAQAAREAELKRWAGRQAELKARIERKKETIYQLQSSVPQDEINEQLRQQNDELKVQLAQLKAVQTVEQDGTPKSELRRRFMEVTEQREDATQRWSTKESRLRDQLDKAREAHDINCQLNALRDHAQPSTQTADTRSKRRSTGQLGTTIHDSISEQVEREVQKVRSSRPTQPTTATSKSRAHSKSHTRRPSRPEPPRNFRHSSAPITATVHDIEDESDASTTDLSFDPAVMAGNSRTIPLKGERPAKSAPKHTGDTTFLSFINGDEIAKLRKQLEEEHRKRRAVSAQAALQTEELTSQSRGTRNLTRKSFHKDLTGRSRASSRARSLIDDLLESQSEHSGSDDAADDERTGRQDTIRSNMSRASNASRRRRSSAFTEMTSAFILPDITLATRPILNADAHEILGSVSNHDSKSCSVCKRILSSGSFNVDDMHAPTPIPVSTRVTEVDATLRPTQGPIQALAIILKQLNDELLHLKLSLHVTEQKLSSTDPSLGKRARKALHERLEVLNRAIEAKSDQIYALYDVVEAHRGEITEGEEEDLPEEVERTLESIREARGGKKVYFGDGDLDGDLESEAPWAGVSDTEGF